VSRAIVVGFDASGTACTALAKAVQVARLQDAKVVVVVGYEIPAAYGGDTGDYRLAVKRVAEEAGADATRRIEGKGVEYELQLVPKRPVDALLSVAEAEDASMIVVGTHGEHPIAGAILGSVPHKLLHVSTYPVLVVPETADCG
jgi:nucleotide-binding universal stress UspA family protein